ncbi:uncharacterized protein WM277_005615 isoform 2-T2 [Molossus nigricans]
MWCAQLRRKVDVDLGTSSCIKWHFNWMSRSMWRQLGEQGGCQEYQAAWHECKTEGLSMQRNCMWKTRQHLSAFCAVAAKTLIFHLDLAANHASYQLLRLAMKDLCTFQVAFRGGKKWRRSRKIPVRKNIYLIDS